MFKIKKKASNKNYLRESRTWKKNYFMVLRQWKKP